MTAMAPVQPDLFALSPEVRTALERGEFAGAAAAADAGGGAGPQAGGAPKGTHGNAATLALKISGKNLPATEPAADTPAAVVDWALDWAAAEREYIAAINADAARHADLNKFMADLARRDLYFLVKYVLGHKDLVFHYHYPLCVQAQQDHNWLLFLQPRGHFKTTCITEGRAIQLVLNNAEVAILIVSGTSKLPKEVMNSVKWHFLGNPKFRELFPEYIPASNDWGTLTSATVPNRKDGSRREPTFTAATTGTKLTGSHFDVIFGDDLINEDNCTTREQIEQAIEWFKYTDPLFVNPATGRFIVSGTRYAFSDVHGWILDNDNAERGGRFKCYVRKAVENGRPIFPERFTLETLHAIRERQGGYIYSCQYDNEPIADGQRIDPSWYRHHRDDDEVVARSYVHLLTDASFSRKEHNDYCGLVVVAAHTSPDPATGKMEKFLDVLEYKREYYNPRQFLNAIWALWDKYKPLSQIQGITVQGVVLDEVLRFFLEEDMRVRNEFLPLVRVSVAKKDKIQRISRCIPLLQYNRLRWRVTHVELEDEFNKYPSSPHDDLSDPLSDFGDTVREWPAPQLTAAVRPTHAVVLHTDSITAAYRRRSEAVWDVIEKMEKDQARGRRRSPALVGGGR